MGNRREDSPRLQLETPQGVTGRAAPCWPEGRYLAKGKGKTPMVGRHPTSSGTGNEAGVTGASEHHRLGQQPKHGPEGEEKYGCHCQVQGPEPDPPASLPRHRAWCREHGALTHAPCWRPDQRAEEPP